MPDYKRGKIYKITSQGKIYIGSTTQSLSQRLGGHKADSKKQSRYASSELVNNLDCQITLIENYACNSREELLARERYHIDLNPNCINRCIPICYEAERKIKYPKCQAEKEILKQFEGQHLSYKQLLPHIQKRYKEILEENKQTQSQ